MFRFTIRDVLWLTVAVALAVGWWLDNSSQLQTQARLREEADTLKVEVLSLKVNQAANELSAQRELERRQELLWKRRSTESQSQTASPPR